ncbi:MAG: hypothetical protein PUP46_11260 [Endozoicomonas sp. (ex Botrylloides leachii)]|nr:hypothetical protein [Endozoicomonas sp. (ex Botrylloides leachii)]
MPAEVNNGLSLSVTGEPVQQQVSGNCISRWKNRVVCAVKEKAGEAVRLPYIQDAIRIAKLPYNMGRWAPTFFSNWHDRVNGHHFLTHVITLSMGVIPWLALNCVVDPLLALEDTIDAACNKTATEAGWEDLSTPSNTSILPGYTLDPPRYASAPPQYTEDSKQ